VEGRKIVVQEGGIEIYVVSKEGVDEEVVTY